MVVGKDRGRESRALPHTGPSGGGRHWPTLLGDLCSLHSFWADSRLDTMGREKEPQEPKPQGWVGPPRGLVQPERQEPVGGPGAHRFTLDEVPMGVPGPGPARWGSPASQVPERGKERPLSMERVKGMRPVS